MDDRQTQALIRLSRATGPGLCEAPDETTWIWSDLHLGHRVSLGVFYRPFGTVRMVNQTMMDAWYDLVSADGTIICLGDVSVDGSVQAHHQRWWRDASGLKWLVFGNHDVDLMNQVRPVEVDRTAATLFAPGDPPLLLTHVPLLQGAARLGERARTCAPEGSRRAGTGTSM